MAAVDSRAPAAASRQDGILAEIIRRLARHYRPEQIYLFGSTARGQAHAESDYDILVLVSDDASPDRRSTRGVYSLLWDIPASIDVLVWSRSEFERELPLRASFPSTVIREGRLVYAA